MLQPKSVTSDPNDTIAIWHRRSQEKARQEKSSADWQERRRLRKQADVYDGLVEELQRLRALTKQLHWAHVKGAENDDPKLDPAPDQAYKEYARLMRLAARNGLRKEDGTIDQWFRSRQTIGDKQYLRSIKAGLEKGVKHPYSTLEMEIIGHALKGKKRSEIRRILIEEGLLSSRISPQNFSKKYRRLWKSFFEPLTSDLR